MTISVINADSFAFGIEILCTRTDRAMSAWQEKVYAAIAQGYQQLEDAYQKAVSNAASFQGAYLRFSRGSL